jgi:hypothetical protein
MVYARGHIGDPMHPMLAVEDELRRFGPDEVIVATHPAESTNWQEADLMARLARSSMCRSRTSSSIAPTTTSRSCPEPGEGDVGGRFTRDWREGRRLRRANTGDTPEKLAEDARRGAPYVYRSTAVPALKAAAVMWIFRGPVR